MKRILLSASFAPAAVLTHIMSYQTVLFIDLDETILKGPFEGYVFPIVLGELAQKARRPLEEVQQLVMQENRSRLQNSLSAAVWAMDWDDIVQTVAHSLGVALAPNIVAETAQAHATPSHCRILDQADEVLRNLSTPQRAIVAATKGLGKYQLPVLEGLGLTSLFSDILTPEKHQALKNQRAFFGTWPQEARLKIMVGDQYQDDVVYPHQFGFKTVWKPQGRVDMADPFERAAAFDPPEGYTARPSAVIFSLRELPGVVKRLER